MQSPEENPRTLDNQRSDESEGERSRQDAGAPILPWLLTLCWMGLIYYFSERQFSAHETAPYFGGLNVPVRKLGHISEYATLMALCFWSARSTWNQPSDRLIATCCFIYTVCYALTDEWHQAFVRGRSATVTDVLWDSLGAVVGYALLMIFMRRRRLRRGHP
jgi:VanZ family protein